MKAVPLFIAVCVIAAATSISSCSRKTHPGSSGKDAGITRLDSTATNVKKATIKTPKAPVPKMIVVNDAVAKKTVDGRMYYDLNGKRYWRNNKDGKYYLFNKSMYNNPDFKPVP